MRILHVITRLILGGAQENTLLSCEHLHRRGHDITLAFGPIYGPEGSLLERARRGGYRLVELSGLVRAIHPWRDFQGYRQMRRLIRESKPEIVHTHSSKAGITGRAAAWAEKVPAVIHTIHGLPFHPYQNTLVRKLYIRAEQWAARRCHRLIGVADAMSRQALAAGIGRTDQYHTVYSGMEVDQYLDCSIDRAALRRKLGFEPHHRVIGTVARLAELKGHDDLLEALGPDLRHHPDWRLLWVGDGWMRPALENRLRAMNLSSQVVISGLVPPQRVAELMRAMDLLVHPSYREGLARTLPQALLCGIPVVSYDADGAGEVCRNGVTGRLVLTGNRSQLAEAVSWMIEHPTEAQAMAQRGREECRKRFEASEMADALERIYHQVLKTGESA